MYGKYIQVLILKHHDSFRCKETEEYEGAGIKRSSTLRNKLDTSFSLCFYDARYFDSKVKYHILGNRKFKGEARKVSCISIHFHPHPNPREGGQACPWAAARGGGVILISPLSS